MNDPVCTNSEISGLAEGLKMLYKSHTDILDISEDFNETRTNSPNNQMNSLNSRLAK